MKKHVLRILRFISVFAFVILLPMQSYAAVSDEIQLSGAESARTLERQRTIDVTLSSSHAAVDGVTSLQFSLKIENEEKPEFVFDEGIVGKAKITEFRYDAGIMNVYVSGTTPLFPADTLEPLKIGCVALTSSKASVSVVPNSLKYVYGTELREANNTDNSVNTAEEGYYEDISEYRSESGYTYPKKNGYVFAGWYADAAYTTAISQSVTSGSAYAKFVDENVLSVKWQIRLDTIAAEKQTSLRVITSVDSFMYRNVGFKITLDGSSLGERTSKIVYKKLVGWIDNTPQEYEPTEFSSESIRFNAYRFTEIPESKFDKEFVVEPFWTTLDGTKVTGISNTFKIHDDRYFTGKGE